LAEHGLAASGFVTRKENFAFKNTFFCGENEKINEIERPQVRYAPPGNLFKKENLASLETFS
jgi:hypothetical protein